MEKLIRSVQGSIASNNWYAVLMTALTLPDIAGKIEFPNENSGRKRYSKWFELYVEKYYTRVLPKKGRFVYLNGSDCYALRCSFLHEGGSNISHQKAKLILNNFEFLTPKPGVFQHNNLSKDVLQLQIDEFAEDILRGIIKWMEDIEKDKIKNRKLNEFLKFL